MVNRLTLICPLSRYKASFFRGYTHPVDNINTCCSKVLSFQIAFPKEMKKKGEGHTAGGQTGQRSKKQQGQHQEDQDKQKEFSLCYSLLNGQELNAKPQLKSSRLDFNYFRKCQALRLRSLAFLTNCRAWEETLILNS